MRPRYKIAIPLVICVLILVVGCQRDHLPVPRSGWPTALDCAARGTDTYYFPAGSLIPSDAENDSQQRRTLSAYLDAAGADSLSCGPETEAYRFFWGGGYGITATVVTVSADSVAVVRFSPPNEKPLAISQKASISVTSEWVDRIRREMEEVSFWSARAFVDLEGEGNVWVIEARQGGSYKVVTRVAPEAALANTAIGLIEMTGLSVPERMKPR